MSVNKDIPIIDLISMYTCLKYERRFHNLFFMYAQGEDPETTITHHLATSSITETTKTTPYTWGSSLSMRIQLKEWVFILMSRKAAKIYTEVQKDDPERLKWEAREGEPFTLRYPGDDLLYAYHKGTHTYIEPMEGRMDSPRRPFMKKEPEFSH